MARARRLRQAINDGRRSQSQPRLVIFSALNSKCCRSPYPLRAGSLIAVVRGQGTFVALCPLAAMAERGGYRRDPDLTVTVVEVSLAPGVLSLLRWLIRSHHRRPWLSSSRLGIWQPSGAELRSKSYAIVTFLPDHWYFPRPRRYWGQYGKPSLKILRAKSNLPFSEFTARISGIGYRSAAFLPQVHKRCDRIAQKTW